MNTMKKLTIESGLEITATNKARNIQVCLENIGEGVCGEYDETDQHDEPLLRFSVYEKVGLDWNAIDDASYCTQLRADLPMKTLKKAVKLILTTIGDNTSGIKKLCERLSWIDEKWVNGKKGI